jgi:phosphate uptake regulator
VARIFVSKLRHRILLNHEAKLAAQIIRDEDKIDDLRRDWAAIDLAMVVDQTTWVCECRADDIENIGKYCSAIPGDKKFENIMLIPS